MAPTPPNTTFRAKLGYSGPYGAHTMLVHGFIGATIEDMRPGLIAFVNALANFQYNTVVWDTLQYAEAGVNFFTEDIAWEPVDVGGAAGPSASDVPSRFVNFVGRSPSTAKRVKYHLFETYMNGDNNMRLTPAENANVGAVLDVLNDLDYFFDAIDGTPVVFKNYANLGQNDYLTHRARRS